MSASQILDELRKLSADQRKEIAVQALEMNWDEAERESIRWAEECALQSFQMMDALEAPDATHDGTR